MALPASGTISLNDLQTEFGGSNPIAISEYYLGGGLVPNLVVNANVPISGQISLSNFYGAQGADPNPNAFNINNIFLSGVNSVSGNSNQITITGINVPITLTFATIDGQAFVNSEYEYPEINANIVVYVNGTLANTTSTWGQSGPGITDNQEVDLKVTVSNNDTIKVELAATLTGTDATGGWDADITVSNDSSGNAVLDTFNASAFMET